MSTSLGSNKKHEILSYPLVLKKVKNKNRDKDPNFTKAAIDMILTAQTINNEIHGTGNVFGYTMKHDVQL